MDHPEEVIQVARQLFEKIRDVNAGIRVQRVPKVGAQDPKAEAGGTAKHAEKRRPDYP